MGGQIGLEVHRLHPRRLRGLILADTSVQAEAHDGKKARSDTADRLLREGTTSYPDDMLPNMLGPSGLTA